MIENIRYPVKFRLTIRTDKGTVSAAGDLGESDGEIIRALIAMVAAPMQFSLPEPQQLSIPLPASRAEKRAKKIIEGAAAIGHAAMNKDCPDWGFLCDHCSRACDPVKRDAGIAKIEESDAARSTVVAGKKRGRKAAAAATAETKLPCRNDAEFGFGPIKRPDRPLIPIENEPEATRHWAATCRNKVERCHLRELQRCDGCAYAGIGTLGFCRCDGWAQHMAPDGVSCRNEDCAELLCVYSLKHSGLCDAEVTEQECIMCPNRVCARGRNLRPGAERGG